MRQDDLFMILSWRHENMINRHWIIEISVVISVFPLEKRLKYNVQDEERRGDLRKRERGNKISP